MQKIINISLIIVILVLGYFQLATNKGELVYVNTQKLMTNYEGMKVAAKEYENKEKERQARVDTLQNEFEQAMKDYEKARVSMSQKERQLSEELLQNKQKQFMQYREAMHKKAQEDNSKMSAEVLVVANEYIQEFGENKGYKIILGATQMGNVVYADEAIDITDEVIEFVNKKYAEE